MKLTAVVLLAQALAVYAKYDMFCTHWGINLANGDFCPGCSRSLLQAEGDFDTPRNCVILKDAYNIDVSRSCTDGVSL
ncbi:hypothetical protein BUE80_DR000335 [Diplocarpon rosae]|nr:hypothetical protein BUE80_DR000335 [Diplocarpon rosae]